MLEPTTHSESSALAAFLREQVVAARTAAHGLTDAEARLTPTRSSLSVGGILKHLTTAWVTWERREAQNRGERGWELTEADYGTFYGSFALTADETLEQVLEGYDAATGALLAAVESMDPGAEVLEAPAPWFGRLEPSRVTRRFLALHLIEEFARHAGHADIVREQLDGAQAGQLTMAVEGIEGNDFMQPWRREPVEA
ncbi:mycothiol transferase [Nocardioides sp. Soil805]|uniref:mycothiol transferase n=1 Tax=Nocardioides sp. Soil805 TaxID=1736416 RepID=UPI000703B0C5|nr:DUF664 domain-containing protein [Nocardioides sp. Soil805]KRF37517.1 hypothetical protein ASG94_09450 [Nocardioides sp. Soil805]